MAWTMQIRESQSWTTPTSEDQTDLSPTSSSTPSDFAELHDYLKHHVQMVMESLGALTIHETPAPISPKMPFDRVFAANIDRCQQNLTWNHLPDDIWTDDIELWLNETTQQAVEVHPAPKTCVIETSRWSSSTSSTTSSKGWKRKYPIPALELFTDIQWQPPVEQYSPSVYSQDNSAVSPGNLRPLSNAAYELMQEMPLSPTRYISMNDILGIAASIADVCIELRATINRAEDSAEFDDSDSDSNSDVSLLDLVEPLPMPAITFYDIARARGLTISDSSPPSSDGSSHHSGTGSSQNSNIASSPSQHSSQHSRNGSPKSSVAHSTQSHIRTRPHPRHHISPDILNRMACLANSGLTIQLPRSSLHECALPTDGTGANGRE